MEKKIRAYKTQRQVYVRRVSEVRKDEACEDCTPHPSGENTSGACLGGQKPGKPVHCVPCENAHRKREKRDICKI